MRSGLMLLLLCAGVACGANVTQEDDASDDSDGSDCTSRCADAGGGGEGAGSSSGANAPNGGGGQGVGPAPRTLIEAGADVLVDVFVTDALVFVVEKDRVASFDLQGNLVREVEWPREIQAATLEEEMLVVADSALFTTLDEELNPSASGELVETCASIVLVRGAHLVCGPENDWDRIFYTFDATSGELLSASEPYTYNGIPMRRVPGSDTFVTVTVDSSPSDFHLYDVDADGTVHYVGESPYHGDFYVEDIYAFHGDPATHLVTHEGLMLEIASPEPFTQDGTVGTLDSGEYFLGMDGDGAGKLYGLVKVDGYGGAYYNLCERGCVVQRIDIASHLVDTETLHVMEVGEVIRARHHAPTSTLVVGYRLPGDYYFPDDPYPGYRVELLPY